MATGLDELLKLVQGIQGSSSTTTQTGSSTQTQRSDMTEEGMQRVLNRILAGPGGVADISGAARGAGLYNSTTELQLQNDLAARAAGELEMLRAGTTTTTDTDQTQVTETPGLSLGGLVTPMLVSAAGKRVFDGLDNVISGNGSFMDGAGLGGISRLFGGGGAATPSAASLGINSISPNIGASLGSSIGGSTALAGLGGAASGLTGAASSLGTMPFNIGSNVGASLGTNLASSAAGFSPLTGGSFALNAVPGAGSFLGGLLGGGSPDDWGGFGIGSSALTGLAAGGPLGMLAAPAMGILGSAFGDVSIICTALMHHGLLSESRYAAGQEHLKEISPTTKRGYYILCGSIAAEIKANKNSKWTKICLPFARSRTNLIAYKGKYRFKRWIKYPLGTLTKIIGEPICWVRGRWDVCAEKHKEA